MNRYRSELVLTFLWNIIVFGVSVYLIITIKEWWVLFTLLALASSVEEKEVKK